MASRGLGTLTLDLIARIGGFTEGLSKAERDLDKRSRAMEKRAAEMGAKFKAIGTAMGVALAAGAAAAGVAIKAAIDSADRLDELSAQLGISTEKLSGWSYAAQLSGVSLDDLAGALPRLSKAIAQAGDEGSKAGKLFKALGIDVRGGLAPAEEILPQLADRFRTLNNQTLETALAMEVFGKSGSGLLEFLNRGSEGIAELEDRAASLGLVISQETAAAAAEFNDRLGDLKGAGQGLATSISSELLPTLTDTVERFVDLVREGDLARNMATLLSGALSAGTGILEGYNNAVARTTIAIGVLAGSLDGLREAGTNFGILGAFNEGSVTAGFQKIIGAYDRGQRELDSLIANQNRRNMPGQVPSYLALPGYLAGGAGLPGIGSPSGGGGSDAEKRLAAYFGGDPKSPKPSRGRSGGASEMDRAAQAAKSLNEQLDRQIALFGTRGEAARVAYDIENGALAKLLPADKEALLAKAQKLDLLDLEKEALDALNDRTNSRIEAQARELEGVQAYIADMEFELSLLGMTNDEREREIALRTAGAAATEEQRKRIVELADAYGQAQKTEQMWGDFQRTLGDSIFDLSQDIGNAENIIKGFFDSIAKQIAQFIAEQWAEQLTDSLKGMAGSGGGGGGWGGFFSSLLGAFGGGRAAGGPVSPGMLYEVNERGPEMLSVRGRDYLMMGAGGGTITPNHRLGGTTLNQTFVVQGTPDGRTRAQMARESGRAAAREMARTGR